MTLCASFTTKDNEVLLFADSVRTSKTEEQPHKAGHIKLFRINGKCGFLNSGAAIFLLKKSGDTVILDVMIDEFKKCVQSKNKDIENLDIQEIVAEFEEFIKTQLGEVSGSRNINTFIMAGFNEDGRVESYAIRRRLNSAKSEKIEKRYRFIGMFEDLDDILEEDIDDLNRESNIKTGRKITQGELDEARQLKSSIDTGGANFEKCKQFFELMVGIVSKIEEGVGPPISIARISRREDGKHNFEFTQRADGQGAKQPPASYFREEGGVLTLRKVWRKRSKKPVSTLV